MPGLVLEWGDMQFSWYSFLCLWFKCPSWHWGSDFYSVCICNHPLMLEPLHFVFIYRIPCLLANWNFYCKNQIPHLYIIYAQVAYTVVMKVSYILFQRQRGKAYVWIWPEKKKSKRHGKYFTSKQIVYYSILFSKQVFKNNNKINQFVTFSETGCGGGGWP